MKHSATFFQALRSAPQRIGVFAALCVFSMCFGWLSWSHDASAAACSYQLSAMTFGIISEAQTVKIDVKTDVLCPWTTVSNTNWIKVTGGQFQVGNGQAVLHIDANLSLTTRTGTATIAGKTVTIMQDAGCAYQVSPMSIGVPGSSATQPKFDVTTAALCKWTTVSNANWIKVSGGLFQTGNGQASLNIEANPTLASRIGTATVAGKTVTITQGAGCATITVNGFGTYKDNVGANFSQPYSVSGGKAPYSFSVSAGSLPPGLALNGNVLSGSLTAAGVYNFTIKATDANGCTGTTANTVTVNPGICPTITVNPVVMPGIEVNKGFTQSLSASGGAAPYTFSLSAGSLPPGLQLNGSGLSGTPTGAGTYNFTLKATDSKSCTGTHAYTLTVNPKACAVITLNPAGLPAGMVNQAFAQSLVASGGTAPYQFSLSAGDLPPGLSLSPNGALTGTPTEPGAASFTIKAIDANGCQATRTYSLTIAPAPLASVSAASYLPGAAPESIVAAFGVKLAEDVQAADTQPLPTTLANVSVTVKDSFGVERLAPLFFVSPGQVNYAMPPGTALGVATVSVVKDNALVAAGTLEITMVAPGLFTAAATGQGPASALALRVKGDGSQSYEPVAQYKNNQFVTMPIDLGPASDQVFLVLYGTGLRYRQNLSVVVTTLGGNVTGDVLFVGAAPGFVGLDQVNVKIPRALIGRSEIDLALMAEGKAANVVRFNVQ